MQIQYKFSSETEPSDEQLHLLMQEVSVSVKNKAKIANEKFLANLNHLVKLARTQGLNYNLEK